MKTTNLHHHDESTKSPVSLVVGRSLLDAIVVATSLSCAGVCLFGFGTFSHVELFVASAGLVLAISAKAASPLVRAWIARRRRSALSLGEEAMTLGPYTLGPKIGQGGMGEVYRARHSLMDRDVAIKILPGDHAADEETCLRFEREVQLTGRLESPNTVAVHDYGRTPDGRFYYVMELVDGYDLDRLVSKFGPVSGGRAVHLLKQVCTALEEAHAIGLVHRDIKPANIALCERAGVYDVVKVLDFGLVEELGKRGASSSSSSLRPSALVGTPAYLAPESILTPDAIDARTDLYSVGAVAYWLLTGKTVFDGNSVVEICSHHIHTPPELPSVRLGRDVPADLEAVILRCLAKDPKKRYASTRELRDALERCECAAEWSSNAAEEWWRSGQEADDGDDEDASPAGVGASGGESVVSASHHPRCSMLWQAHALAS